MSGLYIHIPYCRKACIYCNFHFSVQLKHSDEMVQAILLEMEMRRDFFDNEPLETIYFGGGTPSVLPPSSIAMLLTKAVGLFGMAENPEITLEANPEDITPESISAWRDSGINRLSIGIQSLQDEELRLMNRNHDAAHAKKAVDIALNGNIHSLNVDLIFGSPWLSNADWEHNMQWAFHCGADHISAYALTVEPKTVLNKKVLKKELPGTDENRQSEQYAMLHAEAASMGWDFYEISNLSAPGKRARHNSNYWKNRPYLGVGPSAHSFQADTRSWNIADNNQYIRAIQQGESSAESEILSARDKYNEYLMTHLRLSEGVDLSLMANMAPENDKPLRAAITALENRGLAVQQGQMASLTLSGRLLCDTLTADLML